MVSFVEVIGGGNGGLYRGRRSKAGDAFPQLLDAWVDEDHLVRVDDLCGNELDLASLGFDLVLRLGLAAQCITRQWC